MHVDRDKVADLGVCVQDATSRLNDAVGGFNASSYYEGGEGRSAARDRLL